MSAPLLTLDGLRTRFALCPSSVLDIADDIAVRFAASGCASAAADLSEAARDLLARYPDPSALPLWGIPFMVAANIDVAGLATSMGVTALDFLPDFDADVVERLRTAGALVVGKVPGDLLGLDVPAAGAAASVAAGFAAFAIANDRGCAAAAASFDVVAVQPTHGLISADGSFATAPELDGIVIFSADLDSGTMVRCAIEEVVAIGGHSTMPLARLGILGGGSPEATCDIARRLGLVAITVDPVPFTELAALMDDDVWFATRLDDIAVIFSELPELFPPHLRGRLAKAFDCPIHTQTHAQRCLLNLRRQIEAAFSDFDLLFLSPEISCSGFVNVCGLAAVTLPGGGTLIAPGGHDDRLAAAAAALVGAGYRVSTSPIDIPKPWPLAR